MRYGLIYEKTIFEKLEITYSVDMVRYDFAFDKTACESMSHDMQKLYDYLSDNIRADLFKTSRAFGYKDPVSYTHLDVYKRQPCMCTYGCIQGYV